MKVFTRLSATVVAVAKSAVGEHARISIPGWRTDRTILVPVARFPQDVQDAIATDAKLYLDVDLGGANPDELVSAESARIAVRCALCSRDHDLGMTSTQAPDCAASIHRGPDGDLYLTGHYGSNIDGDAYRIHLRDALRRVEPGAALPEFLSFYREADPVCDLCVGAMKAFGMLALVGDYLHDQAVSAQVFGTSVEDAP